MGSDFDQIRARARKKRDQLIEAARRDYEATMAQIAKLEGELLNESRRKRHCKISESCDQVIPHDRTFTLLDIVDALEKLDPARVWNERSVMGYITRLRDKKLLKRIRRHSNTHAAIYARVGLNVGEVAFPDMTLSQVIRAVLTRPMTITELTIAMLEQGYETNMTRNGLREAVGVALRRSAKFKSLGGGKWSLAAGPFPS